VSATGADVLLDVLRSEGVRHVFGNPGTTELPLMDALSGVEDVSYVLALQEASAAAMADAYAQATGRPAFLNLHTTVGLGNAAGNLANALANGTPLVVTAGQQDERHLAAEPFLSGDLVGMARALAKSAHEVRSPDELGTMLRRAFRDAATPPTGPVFLSIRMDHLQRPAAPAPPRSTVRHTAVAGPLDELADRLCAAAAGEVALVLGDEVAHAGAVPATVALAEALGATAYGAPLFGATVFPTTHDLWGGMLPLSTAAIRAALEGCATVLAIGANPFQTISYTPGPPLAAGTVLLQLSADPHALGRTEPVTLGASGAVAPTVEALTARVRERADAAAVAAARAAAAQRRREEAERRRELADAGSATAPLHAATAARALMGALPADTPLVAEAPTSGAFVRAFHDAGAPGTFFFGRGGGLGWAMPAACGLALARGRRQPVLCAIGDGAAMYSPQALWTAARERLPVLFAIFDNGGYAILRDTLDDWDGRSRRTGDYVALELDDPGVDFLHLAASMGVAATSVRSAEELAGAAAEAVAAGRPRLLHIPIAVAERG